MKKKFAIAVVLLLTYMGFLIATLPTVVVLNQLSLSNNIKKKVQMSGVTGSIWHTMIAQVTLEGVSVKKVDASLSFWSLMSLTPTLSITFGDALIAGPEGELELALTMDKAEVHNLQLRMKANDIAQQLTLPLPLSAQGDVELSVLQADINLKSAQCIAIKGTTSWSKAGVVALAQNIKLGDLNADIRCEKGVLALIISPKNDLGLTFSAYVNKGGKLSGKGYLTPGAKFPQALNEALPFLGSKDNQGRYRLSF